MPTSASDPGPTSSTTTTTPPVVGDQQSGPLSADASSGAAQGRSGGRKRHMLPFLHMDDAQRLRAWGASAVVLVLLGAWAIATDGLQLFTQRLFDGLSNGFIFAIVALALVLIYKATGLVNFAQGEMAMFGTFIAYVLAVENGVPIVLAIGLAMLVSAVAGAAIERVLIRPWDPANHLPLVIITLGLFLLLNGLAGAIWLFEPRGFPSPFPSGGDNFVEIFGARLFYDKLGIWLSAIAAVVLVNILLKKTKIGLAFRAVSSNLESSQLVGIHVGRTLQFGWALAAAMGTLAGALVANSVFLEPNMMGRLLILAFAAATLGGLDSPSGTIVGGIVVGLVQSMLGGYIDAIGSELSLLTALFVIMIVLLAKPTGLFGSRVVERV